MKMNNIYSARAEEQRRQFNKLINSCDMILMNNIVDVDDSIWDNWESITPNQSCEIEDSEEQDNFEYNCVTHGIPTNDEYACDETDENNEVFQWFAVGDSDADFLKRHNQYITYSDKLDTYFLAICHFGTSWDYTGMVNDFDDCYTGLDDFDDKKEVA
jgi:hypothetical protein